MQATLDFLRRTVPNEVGCVGGLWILPGTKVYQKCKSKGFIDDSFWLSDEPYKVYTLEYTLDQLKAFEKRVLAYNTASLFKRMIKRFKGVIK